MYKGKEIAFVHKYLRVTEYEFETVAKRFALIFINNGLDEKEVKFIMNFINSKKSLIVTTKNTPIDRLMQYFYKRIKKLKIFLKKITKRLE